MNISRQGSHVGSLDDLCSINTLYYDYNYLFNRLLKIAHNFILKGCGEEFYRIML